MKIKTWLYYANNILKKNKIDFFKLESEILLSFVIKKSKFWIYEFYEKNLNNIQLKKLMHLLNRRIYGEPIAYILGYCEFWSLKIHVSPLTFIPRSDTEILVEHTLKKITFNTKNVLDLGTGTGAIALAIASEYNKLNIIGIDIIPELINIAKNNANKLSIYNVTFIQSNWFSNLNNKKFDIIVSNPPYIEYKDYFYLEKSIKFEPISSLIAEDNGLSNFNSIILQSIKYLNHFGWIILEHSFNQSKQVIKILKEKKFKNIKTCLDYNGNERITYGQKI
ncbi:peptide chain release factor N(5)-glutamine methyltransferase [Enterobacteriaceae endosymbiont of Plateumaris pusilla]|uniref:peptide chain release factor N(5)-glutamine methyltransferase n=1 Tax=Enterobacteriaceae endosymbiont of Plateumaris pusilla TaxID=2675795 RepID=UPI0014491230|nr:peptide chain release factor N(5)-glutamine methyltransferase [Enterobacteriaceae endosymbiont of Plateumaris pusilla]QJC29411.1 peptide chain release factor N(5)-glutamine methyltransferase [Enterobacteriaceae endosymbiont of Plateumaris pusilla]